MTCIIRTPPFSLVCAVILLGAAACGGDVCDSYLRDFRSQSFDAMSLTPIGLANRASDEGLVIHTLPGGEAGMTGFKSQLRLRGDFEISIGYEIRECSLPPDASGYGPTIYLFTRPPRAAAQLGRICRADGRHVFTAYTAIPDDGRSVKNIRRFPAGSRHGRLRLRRQGTNLLFQTSDSPHDASYQSLLQTEFVTEDVLMWRVAVAGSEPGVSATVVITDLAVSATEILPSEPTRRHEVVNLRWGIVRAILVSGALGLWLVRRRRH